MRITGVWALGEKTEAYQDAIVDVLEMAADDGYHYVSVQSLAQYSGAPVNGAFMALISKLQSTGIIVAFRVTGGRDRVIVSLYDNVDFDSVVVGTELKESEVL